MLLRDGHAHGCLAASSAMIEGWLCDKIIPLGQHHTKRSLLNPGWVGACIKPLQQLEELLAVG